MSERLGRSGVYEKCRSWFAVRGGPESGHFEGGLGQKVQDGDFRENGNWKKVGETASEKLVILTPTKYHT